MKPRVKHLSEEPKAEKQKAEKRSAQELQEIGESM